MKKFKQISILLLMAISVIAFDGCKKGDKGDTGPAGVNGTNGTNGTNGNANVILAVYGPYILSNTSSTVAFNLPLPVTTNMLDSCLVLVYHQSSGCGTNWYASPGLGCGAGYNVRFWTSGTSLTFAILDADGSVYSGGNQTFTKIRVIVAPAANYTGSRLANVNFDDYYSALKFFGLKDIE